MQFSTLALAALASLASAQQSGQKTHVVTVAKNGSLTYSPNKVTAAVGDFVQFQFTAGNHTVTQSTFDAACQPIAQHSNITGFHSGFQPAAASVAMGMIPTYTIQINNTNPMWLYCAQGKHCENGMVMVINENTNANATRSLANYMANAAKASTVVPGSASSGTNSTTSTGSGSGSGSGAGSGSGSGSTTGTPVATALGSSLSAPSTLGLLALAGALFFF